MSRSTPSASIFNNEFLHQNSESNTVYNFDHTGLDMLRKTSTNSFSWRVMSKFQINTFASNHTECGFSRPSSYWKNIALDHVVRKKGNARTDWIWTQKRFRTMTVFIIKSNTSNALIIALKDLLRYKLLYKLWRSI